MPSLATRNPAPTVVQDDVDLPPKFPELPDDVLKRFPSLANWEEDADGWWSRTYNAIQGNNRFVSQSVTKANQQNGDLRVSLDGFVATVTTEIDAIVNEQGAQAKRIVTVSAMAGVSQNIKIQNAPPGGPVLNDIWINNTDLTTPVTYKWDGAQWVEVADPITAAGVADERTARVTADGFLEGKYSLTVIAGNVVTGMNITSATGPGTNVSSVIFRATDFQIYNGTLGKVMFNVSGSDVQLAGTLTVSTSGKVFIGTGTYSNSNTAWYVDSAGKFSLKDNLTWDGSTLTIATTDRVLLTSNSSYLTWQGPSLSSPGLFLQHDTGSGHGFAALAIGSASQSAVFLTKSRGAFGALADVSTDDGIGSVRYQAYNSGGFSTMTALSSGITNSVNTPYFYINVGGVVGSNYYWIFNYDGKLYFATDATPANAYGAPYMPDATANLYRSAAGTLKTDGAFVVVGAVTAASYSGDGSALTALNASNISSGTLSTSRLPATINIGTAYQISGTTVIDSSRILYPASIHGESGGYTVGLYTGGNTLYMKYDNGLDLVVCKVDSTDFILVRAGAHTGSTVTHSGYVTMKDSSGIDRKFMVGT